MAITLITSHRAAANAPTVQFRTLVALGTAEGRYYFSTEPVSYGTIFYQGRLLAEPVIEQALANGVAPSPEPAITLEFADADGWFAQRRPSFFRQHSLSVTDVFLDVNTPVRQLIYVVTETAIVDDQRFRIDAESPLAIFRRRPFPSNAAIINRQTSYQQLPEGAPELNRVIPYITGELIAPMVRINDVTSQEQSVDVTWFAVGLHPSVNPLDGTVDVRQVFNATDIQVESAAIIQPNQTLLKKVIKSGSPPGNPSLPHFARWHDGITVPLIPGEPATRLRDWLTNSVWGANVPLESIDTPTFGEVQSYFTMEESWQFHGAITAQRPVRDWLDEWLRDSATWVVQRDGRMHLFAQRSRAPVASFTASTIIAATLTARDLPVDQEFSRWRIAYHDRTTSNPAAFELEPNRTEEFAAGAGAEFAFTSALVGDAMTAAKVVRLHARRAAVAQREYTWRTGMFGINLEPGDFVTLSDSRLHLDGQLVEIQRTRRQGTEITLTAREMSQSVFAMEPPNLPRPAEFLRVSQTVPLITASSQPVGPGDVESHFVVYSLSATPTVIGNLYNPVPAPGVAWVSSLYVANTSSATVLVKNTGTVSAAPAASITYWLIRAVD